MLFNLQISYNLYLANGHKYMLAIKRTTLLPINCCYGILVFAKIEAVFISIPQYMVFSVYCPTLIALCWYICSSNQANGKRHAQ